MDSIDIKTKLLGDQTRKADVTFYKSGRIDITSGVSKLLNLKRGDVIDVAGDGREWYLYVRHRNCCGRHEAQCYPSNRGGHNFRAYSKRLCTQVLKMSGGSRARVVAGEFHEFENIGKSVIIVPQFNLESK